LDNSINIGCLILITLLAEGANIEDIIDSHWDWETVYFDLYNDDSSSKLIYHGV